MPQVRNLASVMKSPLLRANYFEAMVDKVELYLYLLELESALDLRLIALGAVDVNGRFPFYSLEHSVASLSGLAERGKPGRHLPQGHGPDKHSEDSGDHLSLRCWFGFDFPKNTHATGVVQSFVSEVYNGKNKQHLQNHIARGVSRGIIKGLTI